MIYTYRCDKCYRTVEQNRKVDERDEVRACDARSIGPCRACCPGVLVRQGVELTARLPTQWARGTK